MKMFSIRQLAGGLVLVLIGLYGGVVLRGSPWQQSRDHGRSLHDNVSLAVVDMTPEPLPPQSQEFGGNEPLPIPAKKAKTPSQPQEFIDLELSAPKPQRWNAEPETLPVAGATNRNALPPPGHPDNGRRNDLSLLVHPEIAPLMTQLREATDDAKKAELTKQLESAIVAIFDKDMATRETELRPLEERLTKLRNQLNRRKEAKSEIIQLQLKLMINEADGLGFSPPPTIKGRQTNDSQNEVIPTRH